MSDSYDLGDVDYFTVGAVGEPGHRLFLLQAGTQAQAITVKMEKQQVSALAAYLGELLEDLASPGHLPEDMELREPYEVDWVAGSLAATYDEDLDRVVLLIEEAAFEVEEDIISNAAEARFLITREQAAAVAIHGTSLVESGRPPCPLCGNPLDPSGHACPRTNGNRPPQA